MFGNKKRETFMRYVELHERAWGMDSYKEHPPLENILSAPIVAFWYPPKGRESRQTITLYTSMRELNAELSAFLLHSKTRLPDKRLARLFVKRKQVEIKGVQLVLAFTETE